MRHALYCEYNFLADFYNNRPIIKDENIFSEDTHVHIWKKYCDLFLKNSNLYLNVSYEEFNNKLNHPYIKMIYKKKTEGSIKLKFERFPRNFEDIDNDQMPKQALFFLSDNERCEQLQNNYGWLFISNDDLFKKADILFSEDSFRKIDNNNDWSILQKFKHPCNFILLIDKYLFKKKVDTTNNLKSIFDALLPEKINKKFSIEIRTTKSSEDDWKDKSVEELENTIKEIIESVRSNICVNISIKFIQNSEHDRHLITNYYWFFCGYGFVLTYNQKAMGTDIHIHRIVQPFVLDRMEDLINKNTIN